MKNTAPVRIRRECFQSATYWVQPSGPEVQTVIEMCGFSDFVAAQFLGLSEWGRQDVPRWISGEMPIPYSAWVLLCAKAKLGQVWDFNNTPQDFKLEDFVIPRSEQHERRVYENFCALATSDPETRVLEVNLEWLNVALKGDPIWAADHSERGPETFRPDRYTRVFQEFKSGKLVYMPYLTFDRGRTSICDGRHRLYALMDLNYTHCPVTVDATHFDAISTLVEK